MCFKIQQSAADVYIIVTILIFSFRLFVELCLDILHDNCLLLLRILIADCNFHPVMFLIYSLYMKPTCNDICWGDTQRYFHRILKIKWSLPDIRIERGPEM